MPHINRFGIKLVLKINTMKNTRFILIAILLAFITSAGFAHSKIKVALILDTSNSMDGLIDQAKSQLWNIVNELSHCKYSSMDPKLEIALYEYGNDRLPMREGYIRLVTPFTTDLDHISEKLFKLKTDGGSEYCGQVIGVSLKQLDWGEKREDLRMIFIAGNEPFDQGNVSYREVCKTARQNDIIVNTIFCGYFKEGINTYWKDGAYIGGGEYMNIDQDCRYVYIPSPYDDRILHLNKKLNDTYIGYGKKGQAYKSRQEMQDQNAEGMSGGSAIQRTTSKSSTKYKNTEWDLVDAYEKDSEFLVELEISDLPDEMKNMSDSEKREYIELKQTERAEITKEINDLSAKRNKFVSEEQAKSSTENMLDQAIIEAVKKQALAKNYTFEE